MSGSFLHIVDKDLKFQGTKLIENLGDAYNALEECHAMLMYLSKGSKKKLWKAWLKGYALKKCHPSNKHLWKYKLFFKALDDK